MSLKDGIVQFIHGFKASYNGCIRFYRRTQQPNTVPANTKQRTDKSKLVENQRKLRKRLGESCLLNGLFLLLCILVFNYILMPFLNWTVYKILNENSYNRMNNFLNSFLYYLFSFVWIMPVFLLSKLFNVLSYQDIGDAAYFNNYGKPKLYEKTSISDLIADSIFSCILQVSLFFLMKYLFVES
jgi:hypothetical protein